MTFDLGQIFPLVIIAVFLAAGIWLIRLNCRTTYHR